MLFLRQRRKKGESRIAIQRVGVRCTNRIYLLVNMNVVMFTWWPHDYYWLFGVANSFESSHSFGSRVFHFHRLFALLLCGAKCGNQCVLLICVVLYNNTLLVLWLDSLPQSKFNVSVLRAKQLLLFVHITVVSVLGEGEMAYSRA